MRLLLQRVDSVLCCMLMTLPGSLTYAAQEALTAAQLLVHQLFVALTAVNTRHCLLCGSGRAALQMDLPASQPAS